MLVSGALSIAHANFSTQQVFTTLPIHSKRVSVCGDARCCIRTAPSTTSLTGA